MTNKYPYSTIRTKSTFTQIEARFSSVSSGRVRKPVKQPRKGLPPKPVLVAASPGWTFRRISLRLSSAEMPVESYPVWKAAACPVLSIIV